MTRLGQNVELYTGDTRNLGVTVYDKVAPATSLKNLTGTLSATYAVRDAPGGELLFPVKTMAVGGGIVLEGPPTNGRLVISIASGDTADKRADEYHQELEVVLDGAIVTGFTGRFTLRKSVAGAGS